jgi:hypothetical protein
MGDVTSVMTAGDTVAYTWAQQPVLLNQNLALYHYSASLWLSFSTYKMCDNTTILKECCEDKDIYSRILRMVVIHSNKRADQ